MKKITLLLLLLCTITVSFGQTEWSAWSKISCYKGFQVSVRKLGYVKTVNKYAHQARIKNNYGQKVSFNATWIVAGERLNIGRVTLSPNDVYEHISRYFSKDADMMYVEVDKVSFGDKLNCYASCDNGTPNQPDCDTKTTNKTSKVYKKNTAVSVASQVESNSPIQSQTTDGNVTPISNNTINALLTLMKSSEHQKGFDLIEKVRAIFEDSPYKFTGVLDDERRNHLLYYLFDKFQFSFFENATSRGLLIKFENEQDQQQFKEWSGPFFDQLKPTGPKTYKYSYTKK
jgi:hypothetical protein